MKVRPARNSTGKNLILREPIQSGQTRHPSSQSTEQSSLGGERRVPQGAESVSKPELT